MMDTVVCLAVILIFGVKTADLLPTIETLTECGQIENGNSVILRCRTSDFLQVIRFQLNGLDKALCFANGGTCGSTNTSIYTEPDQHGGIYTDMTILYYNDIENDGNWTCVYGTTESEKLKLSVVECSMTSQSGSGLKLCEWLPIIIGCICGIILILYAIYLCSNKNCKTHAMCWKCSGICYSDYPLATRISPEEWNTEHYCCNNPCCPIKGCSKKCCSCFLWCGRCVVEFPAKRSANDQQGNNTKILNPIMLKPGNDEITHSSTPRSLPVLPPIDKKTS